MATALEIVGVCAITILGFQFVRWLMKLVYYEAIGPLLNSNLDLTAYGKWALVTGCTDGIGLAYAEFIAAQGINIVLVSRNQAKLESTAKSLEDQYKVQTKIIAADFSQTDIYENIEKTLWGYEIGILVNNVGLSYPHPERFLDLQFKEKIYPAIINCNVYAATKMCMIVMPQMVERKNGLVINLSSTAAEIPSPMLSVYSASKAYISKFSADLATEYGSRGITVQCLCPGYVATKMSKIKKSTWMAPSPREYVRKAMTYTGVKEHSSGYFPHTILLGVIGTLEGISVNFTRWIVIRMMENIRKRALKRAVS